MTSRAFAFPRIAVRSGPERFAPTPSGIFAVATWRDDWRRALARAATINAIPSAYANGSPSSRKGGAEGFIGEDARKREVFET